VHCTDIQTTTNVPEEDAVTAARFGASRERQVGQCRQHVHRPEEDVLVSRPHELPQQLRMFRARPRPQRQQGQGGGGVEGEDEAALGVGGMS